MSFNREVRALSHKVRQAGKGSAPRKSQDHERSTLKVMIESLERVKRKLRINQRMKRND